MQHEPEIRCLLRMMYFCPVGGTLRSQSAQPQHPIRPTSAQPCVSTAPHSGCRMQASNMAGPTQLAQPAVPACACQHREMLLLVLRGGESSKLIVAKFRAVSVVTRLLPGFGPDQLQRFRIASQRIEKRDGRGSHDALEGSQGEGRGRYAYELQLHHACCVTYTCQLVNATTLTARH